MTSRRDANLTQNNNTTHIHTDFLKLNLEKTQKEVLQAIRDINISAEISGLTVESNDTITHEKLDTLNSNLVNKHLDSTTDSVTVNTIEGYATEETLGAIKVKTDDLTFSDNDGVIELRVFDSQNNTGLNTINNTITNKHLDSTTDSVTVNLISGFALETTQDAIKTKTDNLSFDLNGAITELKTFDSRSYGKLGDVVTAINDKHLDSTTDSVTVNTITGFALESGGNLAAIKSNTDKLTSDPVLTDAIQVSIKNDTLVVEPINNSINEAPYDLIINGPTLWADSLPAGNPFFADPNGREGWYYDNQSNVLNKSNIYWYANPTSGNLQENDMAFSQLSGMYCVVTNDYVEIPALGNPIMVIYSQPTGTNDIIPTFAHSSWAYSLNSTNLAKLRKGETVMLYTGATRPQRFPNLPSYPLQLAATNGDVSPSEIIAYMSVNTQGTTSKIGYLLQYCGYLNSAIGFNREYSFTNSIERLGEQNLSSLTFEQGKLIIYSAPIVNAIANKHLEFGYDKVDASGSSVSISNFPDTQPVSGTVAFSNTSIEVSGTVAFSNTSIQVSSMPNLNANTDSVTIVPNGDALPVSGTFFQATQPVSIASTVPVSGSVSVSNFPATQPVSIASTVPVSGTFFQETQPVSGSVSVSNFPATQPVSIASTVPVSGTFFQATQPVSGSVSVSNFPETQPVSIASTVPVSGTFFQETQPVSGSVSVSNFPATQPVSIASTVPVSGTFFQETQPISGSISNSFTLDTTTQSSNTKLDTIHADLDGLSFDGSSNLNVNIAAGSISVSSVNIKDSAGNNLNSTSNALNSYITNTSVDTHCYGSIDGTTWHHLKTTETGNLITESKTHDGSNVPITSTLNGAKQSLDVNVSNTVPVSISATVGVSDTTSQGYLNTINQGVGYAYIEAIAVSNATIAGNGSATFFTWTRGQYRRTVFNYVDGNTANTDSISILTKDSLGNGIIIATFFPYVVAGIRQFSGILELSPFNAISIRNNSSSSISAVTLKIFSA